MKRICLILTIFSLFAYALSEDEKLLQAQKQAQSIIQQTQGANQGESIFKGKADRDSTIHDFTNSSIKIDPVNKNVNSYQNAQYQNYSQVATAMSELDEHQLTLLKSAMRNKNLRAIQQKFLRKTYKGTENTKEYHYAENKTQKIVTRFAMATTLIFEKNIDSFILGDSTGFQVEELPNMKNALAIKPLLIGIDTSLTVFTKDKKLHTFFIYSIDHKSLQDPNFVVYIKNEPAPENVIIYDSKDENFNKDYLLIKEGIAEVKVKKDEIYDEYIQKTIEENEWLMAEEIFNDKQFTYFKYDKNKLPQIPAIFTVTDKQDSPIETRVIGDYVIVETTAFKFTIRIGQAYVCVERLDEKNIKQYLTNEELKKIDKSKLQKVKKVKPKTRTQIISKDDESINIDDNGNSGSDIIKFHQNHSKKGDLSKLFDTSIKGKTITKRKNKQ